jgi:hypothetical protein
MGLFSRLFKKDEVVQEEKFDYTANEDIIFNVDNFNDWFNDPDNGATYAHKGIFLRLDKLSDHHIDEYLLNRYNLDNGVFLFSKPYVSMKADLQRDIRQDWLKKLNYKDENKN